MPAIITNKFRIHNQEQFVESFSEASPNVYYMGIGRPQAWATSTRGDSRTQYEGTDTTPLTPVDSISQEYHIFDDLLAAKRVTSSDVSIVIPRRNWTSGTVYDYYRHDYGHYVTGSTSSVVTADSGATSLFDATFYVMNSTYDVYKVIDNNGGVASTEEPTNTGNTIFETSGDGYKWKYMYSLSAAQQTNFLSTDFMAVATNSTVRDANTDGAIDLVKIKSAGSGASSGDGDTTGIAIKGDGSGAEVTVTISSGVVSAVTVTSGGSGYTYGYISNQDLIQQVSQIFLVLN
jgi:hypothetical protein